VFISTPECKTLFSYLEIRRSYVIPYYVRPFSEFSISLCICSVNRWWMTVIFTTIYLSHASCYASAVSHSRFCSFRPRRIMTFILKCTGYKHWCALNSLKCVKPLNQVHCSRSINGTTNEFCKRLNSFFMRCGWWWTFWTYGIKFTQKYFWLNCAISETVISSKSS